jgi:ectoine hydroxylase-related dioxygenase (phytanoyl-CoA dioxygenase family)
MIELAKRNVDFRWPRAPRLGGLLSEEQVAFWDEHGYVLAKGVLDPAAVEAVRAEVDAFEAERTESLRADGPRPFDISDADAITFTTHLVLRSPALRAFAGGEVFARLALDLLGPDVRLYWDQAVYKKPEPERDFPWHQDTGYTFTEPQTYLTCWTPLTAATLDNGCPWIAPDVHRLGTLRHWWTDLGWRCLEDAEGALAVEAEVGDVVCFSSVTPHRTGPNRTADVRKAYILQYAADPTLSFPRGHDGPILQADPDRQFVVARGGRPAAGGAS